MDMLYKNQTATDNRYNYPREKTLHTQIFANQESETIGAGRGYGYKIAKQQSSIHIMNNLKNIEVNDSTSITQKIEDIQYKFGLLEQKKWNYNFTPKDQINELKNGLGEITSVLKNKDMEMSNSIIERMQVIVAMLSQENTGTYPFVIQQHIPDLKKRFDMTKQRIGTVYAVIGNKKRINEKEHDMIIRERNSIQKELNKIEEHLTEYL